jgi:hypothetical protein
MGISAFLKSRNVPSSRLPFGIAILNIFPSSIFMIKFANCKEQIFLYNKKSLLRLILIYLNFIKTPKQTLNNKA